MFSKKEIIALKLFSPKKADVEIIKDMDSSSNNTQKSKAQKNAVIKAIKAIPNDELKFNKMYFEISGFIRRGDIVIYFNSGDFRSNWGGYEKDRVVPIGYARYAKDFNDYTGGKNNQISLDKLDGLVKEMLSRKSEFASKTAASEIKYDELPPAQKKLIKKLDCEDKVVQVFGGIHGYIVLIRGLRFTKEDVRIMASDKTFRWIDSSTAEKNIISIGF